MADKEHPLAPFWREIDRAMALLDTGKKDEAERVLKAAAVRWPAGWFQFGAECIENKDYEQAIERFAQVLKVTQDQRIRLMAVNSIGGALTELGRREEALEIFRKALEEDPTNPYTLTNLGLSHFWNNDYGAAKQYYLRALDSDPHLADVEFYLSLIDLKIGDWPTGWRRYEARMRKPKSIVKKFETPKPEWTGEKVGTLLVMSEQGFGDTIMALRLAPLLAERCDKLVWLTQQGLGGIARQVPGVSVAIDEKEFLKDIPPFDAHIMAMSCFRVLGITPGNLPTAPYLPKPAPTNYGPGYHVGFSWRGSKAFANDIYRSTRLQDWEDLLNTPGVVFHSFQITENEEQWAFADKIRVHEPPKTWADTQARMAGLDLYISVDSGPVHLAGAMGLPVWALLPKSCDFRWMTEGEQSLWYPSIRLYRSKENFQWKKLLAEVKDDLCEAHLSLA